MYKIVGRIKFNDDPHTRLVMEYGQIEEVLFVKEAGQRVRLGDLVARYDDDRVHLNTGHSYERVTSYEHRSS